MTIAVVLAASLAVVCVILVALPFLREPDPETDELDELDEGERRHLELLYPRNHR